MHYLVDADTCQGHGQCYVLAPQVFASDEEAFNAARGKLIPVPPELEAEARLGAESCPEQAIRLTVD